MKTVITCLLFILATITSHGQLIADSVADFSGTQGSNGWWYGYSDVSGDSVPGYDPTNDFSTCPIYDGTGWWASTNYWTSLGSTAGHPNGATNSPGRGLREQWAVRRWVSPVTDTVRIYGHVVRENSECGDGSTVKLLLNGKVLYHRSLDLGDGTGADYAVNVQVHTNDLVDFVITAGCCGDVACDGTTFTGAIEHSELFIKPMTAVEVGVPTFFGERYQMEHSTNLLSWQSVGAPFTGTGDTMYFLFSIRELGSPGYFRVQVVP